jgi:GNAT superfamily N-acetyltransferase
VSARVSYRRPVPGDEDDIAGLCGELGYPSSTTQVAARLSQIAGRDDHLVLVAVNEADDPVGWVHACVVRRVESDPFVELGGMVVSGPHRGRGIGAQLLGMSEEWARSRGAVAVRVRSNVVRERAHGFYMRAGYEHLKTSHVFVKRLG